VRIEFILHLQSFVMKMICLAFCLFCLGGISAQTYMLESNPSEVLTITGASSLHDWTVQAGEVNNIPQEMSVTDGIIDLSAFEISIPISTLDGGRGATMNNKIQKALVATNHPDVVFQLDEDQVIKLVDSESNTIVGELMLAGQSVPILLDVAVSTEGDQLTFTGNEPMKMTDFGIEPPSALFGQIQTKDEIVVVFSLVYKKSE